MLKKMFVRNGNVDVKFVNDMRPNIEKRYVIIYQYNGCTVNEDVIYFKDANEGNAYYKNLTTLGGFKKITGKEFDERKYKFDIMSY